LTSFLVFGCIGDRWSEREWGRETAWQVLHAVDWRQTRYIAKHPDRYYESNPVLGKHPSTAEVDVYFLAGALLHPLITDLLPGEYRFYWQWITIGISGICVGNNYLVGIRMDW